MLPRMGVQQAFLFWAMPNGPEALEQLDRLRTDSDLWISELRALGIHGELLIKRGRPAPWITALAGICGAQLVVCGPPSQRGGSSETIADLLGTLQQPLLLLPDGNGSTERDLLARPLVDPEGTPEARELVEEWTRGAVEPRLLPELRGTPDRAARQAIRHAVEVDATLVVLAGRARALVPHLIRYVGVPLLAVPAQPKPVRRPAVFPHNPPL